MMNRKSVEVWRRRKNSIKTKKKSFHFAPILAYRIHCSESTAGLLQEIGGFQLECRGITEIKVRFVEQNSTGKCIQMKIELDFRAEEIIKLIG